MTDPLDLDALDKQHYSYEHPELGPCCKDCHKLWPCPTSTLIAVVRKQAKALDAMDPDDWSEIHAEVAALVDLGEPT